MPVVQGGRNRMLPMLRRVLVRVGRSAGLIPPREVLATLREIPSFDAAEDHFRTTGARLTYLICSVPRSGSTLLGHGLWASGLGGKPAEYFNPLRYTPMMRRWGSLPLGTRLVSRLRPEGSVLAGSRRNLTRYLHDLVTFRTGRNGAFGAKLHFAHYRSEIAPLSLREILPSARFVSIRRRDRISQAVSLLKARQTQRYRASQAPTGIARYDFAALLASHTEILEEEHGWDELFTRERLTPFALTYEELARDYPGTIVRTLRFIGVDPPSSFELPEPALRKQSDASSAEWAARYLSELDEHHRHGTLASRALTAGVLDDRDCTRAGPPPSQCAVRSSLIKGSRNAP